VAFPLVSAGIYGWPKADAIAAPLEVFRSVSTSVQEARLVAFDRATYEAILGAL
jgi:O-acetyl-ADP-ribose deacetylase (regulator of RNase III)